MRFAAMQTILQSDSAEAIQTAAQLGFDGIELAVTDSSPECHQIWTSSGREKILDLSMKVNIQLPSLALSFLNSGNVTSDDAAKRENAKEAIGRAITAASDLPISVILVPFFGSAEISSATRRERVIKEIGTLAKDAETTGITLALENTLSAEDNHELLKAINSPRVKIYYDVSNATWWGHDPAEEIRRFNKDIIQIHFKDGDGSHSNAPLGKGHVDYQRVKESIHAVNYEGWIVLESVIENNAKTDASKNLSFAKELMEE